MAPLSRSTARAASATLGLVTAVTLALPADAQPLDELPDFLAPRLPHGVDRLCGGAIVPDLPPGELQAVASASEELPPLPEWCDGTCVIDIAFFYDPEAIDGTRDGFPATVGELRARAFAAINVANVAYRRAGLDAELRFVGMEHDPGLSGQDLSEGIRHVHERLIEARQKYGADLVYAITGSEERACGRANLLMPRHRDNVVFPPRNVAKGAIYAPCLGATDTLAHEVGHNLGLSHNPESYGPNFSDKFAFVPFGHGYEGQTKFSRRHKTIMHASGGSTAHFSTPEPVYGRVMGNAVVSDATRALRYTIPDATRYSPTVVPHRDDEDPRGYGCRPSGGRACLNERRFDLSARYSTSTVSRAPAKRLETYGLGDSGALFYFFGPDNPEMLVKVVNGCWLNDHWWVFGSAATDLVYELAIDDLADGGGTVEYRHNGDGVIVGDNGYSTAAGVINDTSAFPCGRPAAVQAGKRGTTERPVVQAALEREQNAVAGIVAAQETGVPSDHGCVTSGPEACLSDWRFWVIPTYSTQSVSRAPAQALETYGLGDSASLFYFFGHDNPEMLVKVVNGCAINGHWWVFGSAATDLQYNISIFDWATTRRVSGGTRFERWNSYDHHGGGRITSDHGYSTRAGVISDTTAFPCDQ